MLTLDQLTTDHVGIYVDGYAKGDTAAAHMVMLAIDFGYPLNYNHGRWHVLDVLTDPHSPHQDDVLYYAAMAEVWMNQRTPQGLVWGWYRSYFILSEIDPRFGNIVLNTTRRTYATLTRV